MQEYYNYKGVEELKKFTDSVHIETIYDDHIKIEIIKNLIGYTTIKGKPIWTYTVRATFIYCERLEITKKCYKSLKPALKYADNIFEVRNNYSKTKGYHYKYYPKHFEGELL